MCTFPTMSSCWLTACLATVYMLDVSGLDIANAKTAKCNCSQVVTWSTLTDLLFNV